MKRLFIPVLVMCALGTACSSESEDDPAARSSTPLSEQQIAEEMAAPIDWTAIGGELAVGDSGAGVRQAYRYFLSFGYFENPVLKRRYPNWSPIVAVTPTSLDVFGPELEAAVSAFQARAALDVTGKVDAATLALLRQPRCANPDGFEVEVHQKWDFCQFCVHTDGEITYKITSYPSGTSPLQRTPINLAIASAFNEWMNHSNLTSRLVESNQPADLELKWETLAGTLSGSTDRTPGGAPLQFTTKFNQALSWSTTGESSKYDVQTVAIHEIGHALAFTHSSRNGGGGSPVMWHQIDAGVTRPRTLQTDDLQGLLASPYTDWSVNPHGTATDIGIGGGEVWITGTGAVNGGFPIFRKQANDTWGTQIGGGAVRVAVTPNGIPWIVNSTFNIFRRRGVTSTNRNGTDWGAAPLPGGATDIAIGSQNNTTGLPVVFIIGTDDAGGGNHSLFNWDWRDSDWDYNPGIAATNVAVDSDGNPWVVNAAGVISRRIGGVWNPPPVGQISGLARDIAAGPAGSIWIIGTGAIGNDFEIWTWQEQLKGTGGAPLANAKNEWVKTAGWATHLAVGTTAAAPNVPLPWVVNSNGSILRRRFQ